MKRHEAALPGMSREASADLKSGGGGAGGSSAAMKSALIGDIQDLAGQLKEDPPIGIHASSVEQLKQLKHHLVVKLKNRKEGRNA